MRATISAVCLLFAMASSQFQDVWQEDAQLYSFRLSLSRFFHQPTDLVFVLDESGSVGSENFPTETYFAELITRMFAIAPDKTRVALITFDDRVRNHMDYIQSGDGQMCNFLASLKLVGYHAGWTHTSLALREAGRILDSSPRRNVHKVIVLLSDGESTTGYDPIPIANTLKNKGVVIFSVGVLRAKRAEMLGVASSEDHLYMIQDFELIRRVNENLRTDNVNSLYVPVEDKTHCGTCDQHASCFCGSDGLFGCACLKGFEGTGTAGKCSECPVGTYASDDGHEHCVKCPSDSTTVSVASTSKSQCQCKDGYAGTPSAGLPCTPISCPELQAPFGGHLHPPDCGHTANASCSFYCEKNLCPYDGSVPDCNLLAQKLQEARICLPSGKWSGREFSCERVSCPELDNPQNGRYRCSASGFTFKTTCELECNSGYRIPKGQPKSTLCQVNGRWNKDLIGRCDPVQCGVVKLNTQKKVKPPECGTHNQPYGTTCQFYCIDGYEYIRRPESFGVENIPVGQRKCGADGKWIGTNEKHTCKDVVPPKITCPPPIKAKSLPWSKSSEPITWEFPTATDNDEGKDKVPPRISLTFPKPRPGTVPIKSPYQFPIGLNQKLVYTAVDMSGLKSTCSIRVDILDGNRPTVTFCPPDREQLTVKSEVAVVWKEPKFFDASGETTLTYQSHRSGDIFKANQEHEVVYTVQDKSQNEASCRFRIRIKGYDCPYHRTPLNGALACVTNSDGQQMCSPSCNDGYEFFHQPEQFYTCIFMRNEGPVWVSASTRVKKTWPDCSKKTSAKESVTLTYEYESDDCTNPEKQNEIARQLVANLRRQAKKTGKKSFCKASTDCTLKSVNVACRAIPTSSKMSGAASNRVRAKREEAVIEHNQDVVTSVQFETADYDYNSGEDLVETEEVDDILQQMNLTVTQSVALTCNPGQLLQNESCVNCPQGTFHNPTSSDCEPCPLHTFQDEEASSTCKPCPNDTMTLWLGMISSANCLAPCEPGTYSDTGLEQCVGCEKGTYQDLSQQTSCKQCPSGKTTWSEGTSFRDNCTVACTAGHYSETGYAPCLKCPVGSYQPAGEQTECLLCHENSSTLVEGATSDSACQAVDACSPNPCENDGVCNYDDTTENGFNCACVTGFAGWNCDVNIDDCEVGLCLNNATCLDRVGDYSCQCLPGFTGERCEIDSDDCPEGACLNGGICRDGVNTYTCECPAGLGGNKCEYNYDDCASSPCQNGGSCYDLRQGFRCCCMDGYSGTACEVNIDDCQTNPCLNGGQCKDGINNFTCTCSPGFDGTKCEMNVDDCSSSPCENYATCVDGANGYSCVCHVGFKGINCEIKTPADFDLMFPSAKTTNYVSLEMKEDLSTVTVAFFMKVASTPTDRSTPVSFSHFSKDDWTENSNALTFYDYNKFVVHLHDKVLRTTLVGNSDSNWHHYGLTWSTDGGKWFLYRDGEVYSNGDGVAVNKTLWRGTFVLGQDQDNLGGGFSATEAFQGKLSQFNVWNFVMTPAEMKQLSQSCGRIGNVISWSQTRDHLAGDVAVVERSELCSGKETCGVNGPECHCQNNYVFESTKCELKVDSCLPNSCSNNQTCMSDGATSYCDCAPGLKGKFCQFDVNECSYGEGGCQTDCINTIGSYHCTCKHGYKVGADGHSCEIVGSGCTDDDKNRYADNQKWESQCRICFCSKGKISCTLMTCPPPPDCPQGHKLVNVPGQCCPTCIPLPSGICSIQPNNEYTSFDGKVLTFTSTCRYVLAQDCIHASYSIQVENSQQKLQRKQVMVIADCTNVTITPHGQVFVDSKKVKLPFLKSANVKVQAATKHELTPTGGVEFVPFYGKKDKTHSVLVTLKEDVLVLWSPSGLVTVGMQKNMQQRTCGLCGNFNGRTEDDFATRTYLQAETVTDFLFGWRVNSDKHCPAPDYPEPGRPPTGKPTGMCKSLSADSFKEALARCDPLRNKAFSKCYAVVNPREYYDGCLQDACRHPKENSFCDSLNAYEDKCRQRKIVVNDWDKTDTCSSRCINGMVFNSCGPPCPKTCSGKEALNPLCKSTSCRTGCYCPTNLVLHEGKCISPADCPPNTS